MPRLLQTFLDIALWRKGPQDLPASPALAFATLAAYIAVELTQLALLTSDASRAMTRAITIVSVDVAMLVGWSWLVLSFFARRQRFVQTITATLGVGVVLLLLDIAVLSAHLALGWGQDVLTTWVRVRLLTTALVVGRIFMHALDRSLITGMALTIAIIYSTQAVEQLMLHRLWPAAS